MAVGGVSDQRPFRSRHTVGQRIVLVVNCLIVVVCLAASVLLIVAKNAGEQSKRVTLTPRSKTVVTQARTTELSVSEQTAATSATAPTETFPAPDPHAVNFLIVGADNNACIDPNSKYAPGIGQRSATLTDTIMVIRVDPSSKRAAVLSFPRDLWVRVGGGMRRINAAYRNNDPNPLVDTINNEFQVTIDHFIRVDFCAFMQLVDAVGGISMSLPYPVRDINTGLDVPDTQCHRFAGDEALAYVRSRHLEYQTDDGSWHKDPSSDFGRIARQQDFLRRTLTAAKQHLVSAAVISGLYSTYKDYLVIDDQLTIDTIIQLAGVLRDVDPSAIRTYQIESTSRDISGQAVQIAKNTPEMTAILDIFRGKSPLLAASDHPIAATTTTTNAIVPGTSPTTASSAGTASTDTAPAATEPQSNEPPTAILPNPTIEC
jgi:LCP family protein required for cell wall assembly